MKPSLILCAALACGAALAQTTPDHPANYGWSMQVAPPAGAGIVRLPLPREVYLHAHSASLADVRLFDRDGQRLSFAIGAAPAQSNTQRSSIAARIFPVKGTPSSSGGGLQNVDIRASADGRLLSVRTGPGPGPGASSAAADSTSSLQALILDLGQPAGDQRIAALRFTPPPGLGDYSAQVLLEASDDLKHWDAIGTTTLNWLRNRDTQTLANDSIDFAPRAFRYARLSWQDGAPVVFAAIAAQAVSQTGLAAPRATIALQATQGKQAGEWVYATPLAIPADSIALQLPQANMVLPVTLGVYRQSSYVAPRRLSLHRQTRPAQGTYFEPLLSTSFYRISDGGKERVSSELAMPVVQTTQWVLRPQNDQTALPATAPALRLGWTPETLVFLASGKEPYQLVFGKGDAGQAALPLAQVAPGYSTAELQSLPLATVGPLTARAGAAAADTAATDQGPPWRLAALWAALLLGVGVLGFFAWRLLSQMKQEQTPP